MKRVLNNTCTNTRLQFLTASLHKLSTATRWTADTTRSMSTKHCTKKWWVFYFNFFTYHYLNGKKSSIEKMFPAKKFQINFVWCFRFYHPRSGVVKLCLSFCLLLFLGRRLSVLVPAFEPDTENDSVWASYFLTTPLQGCVRTFLIFLSNLNIWRNFKLTFLSFSNIV